MGRAIDTLEKRLNRECRGDTARRVRGVLVVAFLTSASLAIGWAASNSLRLVPYGWLAELVLVMSLLAQRSLYQHISAVAVALDEEGLIEARLAVARIVGRNPESLDQFGVARGAVESCAENFADGVIAPVFWYALLGLPGLIAYKMVNTLDSMVGYRSPRYREFGLAAAKIDDLLNFIPARLAATAIALAAFALPRANAVDAFRTMLRDAPKHRSPNAGWPEAAMAGALGIALAGPRRYGETIVKDEWIGGGRARVTTSDIRRALTLLVYGCVLVTGSVAIAAFSKHATEFGVTFH